MARLDGSPTFSGTLTAGGDLVGANAGPGWATLWWHPPTPGFVLPENLNLSTTNWGYSLSGATNPIVVAASLPAKFYRLHKP